jgi:hypothetical protein
MMMYKVSRMMNLKASEEFTRFGSDGHMQEIESVGE